MFSDYMRGEKIVSYLGVCLVLNIDVKQPSVFYYLTYQMVIL